MDKPLVTVLLCHNGLRHMVKMAIDSYLSQDYPNCELIVVDDGPEPIQDLVSGVPNCLYLHFPAKNLSTKRNVGIREARGEYIVHFDADDWSGPCRISDQVGMLTNSKMQVAGYSKALWYDFVDRRASYYHGCVWGATLLYRREYAVAHAWDENTSYVEDGPFLEVARLAAAVASGDGGQQFVATMHAKNARRAAVGTPGFWPFVGLDALPEGFRKAAAIC